MELHHFHVSQFRPGSISHGHPVAGRHVRVGGLPIDASQATGGQQHRVGVNGDQPAFLFVPGHNAADLSVPVEQDVHDGREAAVADVGDRAGRVIEGAGDLSSG